MNVENKIPRWQKEIDTFKGIKSTFIIEGNVNDRHYPLYNSDGDIIGFQDLSDTIIRIFESTNTAGYYKYLLCDPLDGFFDPAGRSDATTIVAHAEKQHEERNRSLSAINECFRNVGNQNPMVHMAELLREIMTQAAEDEDGERKSVAVILNFASNFIGSSTPDNLQQEDTVFFVNLQKASLRAIQGNTYINTMVLIVNKFNDVPAWFYLNNPNVRTITIPNPERTMREDFILRKCFPKLADESNREAKDKLVDLTDGMKLMEIAELRKLHQKLQKPLEEIAETVSIYKYGFRNSPWEDIRDKVRGTDMTERLERRVKGQKPAIKKVVQIIKRSVIGLSGMQHSSNSNKPRGILFLAGTTGTGKTELVKAVTEMLFEDENAMIRFDMSEYTEEHAAQKLFGAPPGYVGYDNGGQLTNAVRNNPCSVLLFDEIEKAHSSVMDKFLQILEDGRMTDGQGNTVYFSETLIFFTSNVGTYREIKDPVTGKVVRREDIVKPGEPYGEIMKKVKQEMDLQFKPEVMNRIGDNVVVFNYIDENVSREIEKLRIESINEKILKKKGITIKTEKEYMELIHKKCLDQEVKKHGGRGIGNIIETEYLNPVAEFIFDEDIRNGDTVTAYVANDAKSFQKE